MYADASKSRFEGPGRLRDRWVVGDGCPVQPCGSKARRSDRPKVGVASGRADRCVCRFVRSASVSVLFPTLVNVCPFPATAPLSGMSPTPPIVVSPESVMLPDQTPGLNGKLFTRAPLPPTPAPAILVMFVDPAIPSRSTVAPAAMLTPELSPKPELEFRSSVPLDTVVAPVYVFVPAVGPRFNVPVPDIVSPPLL
jgi:hypothetical protein